ncbi:MAG: HD domain-containing protein [Lachnospiraceae bacterium]|nr:HD domain-containing protein [Lachnospiraceae bacterium]
MEQYYLSAFAISLAFLMVYINIYHRHFDVHLTFIFALVPLHNLTQYMISTSQTLEEAYLATRMNYISGCYLILMVTLAVFQLCDIQIPRLVKLGMYLLSTMIFLCSQTIGSNHSFYGDCILHNDQGISYLEKHYGPLHNLFYGMIILYFLIGIGGITYSLLKKNQISNRFILLLAIPEVLSFLGFFGNRLFTNLNGSMAHLQILPWVFNLALIIYLIIAHKLLLYNIADTAIDTVVSTGETGFISFDQHLHYLGSNPKAKQIFPTLANLSVDRLITKENFDSQLYEWLIQYQKDSSHQSFYKEVENHIYLVTYHPLYDGKKICGYQIFLTDDTKNQEYIRLLDRYNTDLEKEVDLKTKDLIRMHNNLILSMATVVESRDNSTGGHIRRTSEGVRLLMDEIMKDNPWNLTTEFYDNIIKAAPMHDLGKIAVDDAILRKPGRFTDEEFAIMKTHAAEGARIVHEILKNTPDEHFRILAENVAHYHHERFDGSGYPMGLKGEEIPLEARIMAIADVYDALVSKRVYKDSLSFEKAHQIIMEGMGKHFDKQLERYYLAAKPHLEAYYSTTEESAQNLSDHKA